MARASSSSPKKGNEGKEYVFTTYRGEVKKVGGEGLITYGKAAVSTSLIVGSEAYNYLMAFLVSKKDEVKEAASNKMNN